MIYLQLFWVFFKIGLFGFGGGYSMISLIRTDVVDAYGWMSAGEYADLLAISQMTPGPISINTATFVGYSQAGLAGAIVATASLCLPSVMIMALVIRVLFKHRTSPYVLEPMRIMVPVVAGLIIAAAVLMCDADSLGSVLSFAILAVTIVANMFFKVNPILLIIASGLAGYISGIV